MADQKLTDAGIPLITTLSTDDLLYVVDDPDGTPVSSKTDVATLDARYLIGTGSAVADATGTGDVVAQLNALLAELRTLGLIAT